MSKSKRYVDPEEEKFVKTALNAMKDMANEHPTPEKKNIEDAYKSFTERVGENVPTIQNCLKDYSKICPQGFVAMLVLTRTAWMLMTVFILQR